MKILISNKLSSENVSKIHIDMKRVYVNDPSDEMMEILSYIMKI